MKTNKYNQNGYVIRISESSLIQMILSGLEAYSILHPTGGKSQKKVETGGWLWGHEINIENKTLYCIEMLSIDTSAERHRDKVIQNDLALQLKEDILTSFWPQYEFLSDFHTHPEGHYADVIKDKGYQFSKDDYNSIQKYSKYWQKYNYRVGIVLTIATLERRGQKEPCWIPDGTIEFTLNNCRLWIKGYIAYTENNKMLLSSHDDENISIDCPSIVGLFGEHTPFCRISPGRRTQ